MADWDPVGYARFRAERLRPALDLLARVGDLPSGPVIDLGCGAGAVAGALRDRYPDRTLIGVDSSRAMLAQASGYDRTDCADIADWSPAEPPALIFSNASLHWLDNHPALLLSLAGFLPRGGWLAVQMPDNWMAPSHSLLRQVATRLCPETFPPGPYVPPVAAIESYLRLLAPLGEVTGCAIIYHQRLCAVPGAHPVRSFVQTTGMRPFLTALDAARAAALIAAYDTELAAAYPADSTGSVWFPFRRILFTLKVA